MTEEHQEEPKEEVDESREGKLVEQIDQAEVDEPNDEPKDEIEEKPEEKPDLVEEPLNEVEEET